MHMSRTGKQWTLLILDVIPAVGWLKLWLCAASCTLQQQRYTCHGKGKQWQLVILDVTQAVGSLIPWLCAASSALSLRHMSRKGKQWKQCDMW